MHMNMRVAKPKYPATREVEGKHAQILAAVTVGTYAFWVGLYIGQILSPLFGASG
jgi:hypothetical protein